MSAEKINNNLYDSKKWSLHTIPKDDELFSSWLSRLANGYGLSGNKLMAILFPNKNIKSKGIDMDRCDDTEIFHSLSEKCGIETDLLYQTSLNAFNNFLFEGISEYGPINWIMPWNNPRKIERFGIQFCPICLAEDKNPYFRKIWRLSFVVSCTKHKIILNDRCPQCTEPVNYYRVSGNDKDFNHQNVHSCYSCQYDFRDLSKINKQMPNESEVNFQKHLEITLKQGWVSDTIKLNHSHLYFHGLHLLMGIFASKNGTKLRNSISRHLKTEDLFPDNFVNNRNIERLSLSERRYLNVCASFLISDWPQNFLMFCEENKLWGKTFFRSQIYKYAPFWIWQVIDSNLVRPSYRHSEQEVKSIAKHIKKYNLSRSDAVKLIGVNCYRVHETKFNAKTQRMLDERNCPHCNSLTRQTKSSDGGCRPQGNYRYRCTKCKKTNTPIPLIKRIYSKKFKRNVIKQYLEIKSLTKVAKKFDIQPGTVSTWYRNHKSKNKIT